MIHRKQPQRTYKTPGAGFAEVFGTPGVIAARVDSCDGREMHTTRGARSYAGVYPVEACYLASTGQLCTAPYKWEGTPEGAHSCDYIVSNAKITGWVATESYSTDDSEETGPVSWFVEEFDKGEATGRITDECETLNDAQALAAELNLE